MKQVTRTLRDRRLFSALLFGLLAFIAVPCSRASPLGPPSCCAGQSCNHYQSEYSPSSYRPQRLGLYAQRLFDLGYSDGDGDGYLYGADDALFGYRFDYQPPERLGRYNVNYIRGYYQGFKVGYREGYDVGRFLRYEPIP
ncbi:MAG: hypothetical protein O7G85_15990 [Planctomycetota bacterium]|nr:hypothetical protein [Planctomycetota bacterium]